MEWLPLWACVVLASAGGSATFTMLRPQETIIRAIGSFSCGLLTGFFLAFAVCEWLGLAERHHHMFVAYMLGLLGMSLAQVVVMGFEAKGGQMLLQLVYRILGVHPGVNKQENRDEPDPPASRDGKEKP